MKLKNKLFLALSLSSIGSIVISAGCANNEVKGEQDSIIDNNKDKDQKGTQEKKDPNQGGSTQTPSNPGENNGSKQGDDNKNDNPGESKNPGGDEANTKPEIVVDFSDLDQLNKTVSVSSRYSDFDAASFWSRNLNNLNNLLGELHISSEISNKYTISYAQKDAIVINQTEGKISNIELKFQKDAKHKILTFEITGLMAKNTNSNNNNKENHLSQLELTSEVTDLYPSLVANMLLYVENTQLYSSKINNTKPAKSDYIINFDSLLNKNPDLMGSKTVGFGPGTKNKFYSVNQETAKLYTDKIIGATFDDLQGTLGLEVLIANSDENHSSEAQITKRFTYSGFRKIDLANPKSNLVEFFGTPQTMSEIINSVSNVKKLILDNKNQNDAEVNLTASIDATSMQKIKYEIYKSLDFSFTDNKNAYQLRYSGVKIGSLAGMSQSFALYPFYTRVDRDEIFDNLELKIKNSNYGRIVAFSFNVKLKVGASNSYSNLVDHPSLDSELLIPVEIYAPLSNIRN
ncbi:LppA-related lipoprotein [Mycoplasma simbae]|uniref:LppA-related lipoprotein n=1 Tax=Mycoplasma simbae TaxID=36744 RepID=UPI000498030D|nr:hypothetical protein [Mycoplasma simbae]